MQSFNPYSLDPKPCWHCTRFLALAAQGSAAVCGRGLPSSPVAIVATPRRGCAFFDREVGADDEPDWVPKPLSAQEVTVLLAGRTAPARVATAREGTRRSGAQR